VYHTWDDGHATQHYMIDDGTDDNEVVDMQHKVEGIWNINELINQKWMKSIQYA